MDNGRILFYNGKYKILTFVSFFYERKVIYIRDFISRKKISILKGVVFVVAFIFFVCPKPKSMHINGSGKEIKKIQCKYLRKLIVEFVTENEISAMEDFLKSFTLDERYSQCDCQRPGTTIILCYKDGSSETIDYEYTSLVYRDVRYKIDINRTTELDELIQPSIVE